MAARSNPDDRPDFLLMLFKQICVCHLKNLVTPLYYASGAVNVDTPGRRDAWSDCVAREAPSGRMAERGKARRFARGCLALLE
jgi:hypothetical protein